MNDAIKAGYGFIMRSSASIASLAVVLGVGLSQLPLQTSPDSPQLPSLSELSTTFNSSFSLTQEQISSANLTQDMVHNINLMMRFERSQMANGGPRQDDFYVVPTADDELALKPGQVLKVQTITDTYAFGIAPGTTLSRIIYTSQTLNGTLLPASAYVLWPFQNRQFPESNGAAPAVLWNHGTSGFFADHAPSSHRVLQYGDMLPFNLALAGYAVVAPDYAGLGIGKTWDGSEIRHQYFAGPSGARDAILAMQAARSAFESRLDKRFVVTGHSQGGGVAWATAEYIHTLQESMETLSEGLRDVVEGYMGTMAMAPITSGWSAGSFVAVYIATIMDTIFPDFKIEQWLTPLAIAKMKLYRQVQGSVGVLMQLLMSGPEEDFLHPGWYNSSYHGRAFGELCDAGGKPFAGPMLVLQGTKDVFIHESVTTSSVEATCKENPGKSLEYIVVDGYGHTPMVSALRFTLMTWLEDRFHGKPVDAGCSKTSLANIEGSAQHGSAYGQWSGAEGYTWMSAGYI